MKSIISFKVHLEHQLTEYLQIYLKMECIKLDQADLKLKKLYNIKEKAIAPAVST